MDTIRAFFTKSGHFFSIFKIGHGRPPPSPPPPPPSCAPEMKYNFGDFHRANRILANFDAKVTYIRQMLGS